MRIVLAYAGDRPTTAAIPWLRANARADVIAVILDLGRGRALEAVRDRALAAGAVRAHVVEARESFVRDFVLPSLRADAGVEGEPGIGRLAPRALGQLLLSQTLVSLARIERAGAVAHACAADSLDRARVESAVRAVNRGLMVIATSDAGGASSDGPAGAGATAGADNDTMTHEDGPFVADENVWGRTLYLPLTAVHPPDDSGVPESAFALTRPRSACATEPARVAVRFEQGTPVALNGVAMPPVDLLQSLGTIAGAHGIGRVRHGAAWVEAPAAVVLLTAHNTLQARVWDADTLAFARTVSARYADLIDAGGWFLPLRDSLDAFVARSQNAVNGTVSMTLFGTEVTVDGVEKAET